MSKPASKLQRKLKNSTLVVILPMIGIGVGYLLLMFLPNFREMQKQRDMIQLKRTFIAKTESLQGEISELQADVLRTQKFCADWAAKAPTESEMAPFHMQVNKCVSEAGASVTGFDPQEPVAMKTVDRIPVTLRAAGTFKQVHTLLAKLEALPETIWMENLRLKSAGKNTEQMDCEVTLVVFAKKSEKLD